MGETTGIAWTDSTYNSWWGCTKVGPACDDCYAEAVDRRTGESHWGHGAPRRLLSEHARNEPYRWQRGADKFQLEHGRDRRAFPGSMNDIFDNEVSDDWRLRHLATMEECNRIRWQPCTKRISNLPKMVPARWLDGMWPQNIGMMVTATVHREREQIERLVRFKKAYGIPWIGVSYEPAEEFVDMAEFLHVWWNQTTGLWESSAPADLDWIIFGGKSGAKWNDRRFDLDWGVRTLRMCQASVGGHFFMKQVAAFRPTEAMIPDYLKVRDFPKALQ